MKKSRTPPGVRELKHEVHVNIIDHLAVAPLPGCVN